jgi:osmoprotectant transport system permease protein
MREQLALLPGYLTAHLQLTLFALLVGIAFSIPAGVFVTRRRWLNQPVLAVASAIQTIPSLALLAVMVPALAAVGVRSIGFLPAFIGLVLYSILPILRGTVTGLETVDAAVVEAARSVGMTPGQRFRRVELPLALPVIVAGIRTATVWTVGIATLSTPVGAPSLGNYIFSGLQTRNFTAVLVGSVAAAVLALCLDALVRALGATILGRRRGWAAAVLVVIGLLYAYTLVSFAWEARGSDRGRIVVGAKTFTEQYILSHILSQQIRARTDLPVEVVASLGSTVAFDALRTGQIDAYVDYSGTIWATIMRRDTVPSSRADVLDEVRRFLTERDGIEVVGALGFENAYALAMRRPQADTLGIGRVTDLARYAPRMVIGGDYEFFGRPEWAAIRHTYGLVFARLRTMDASLMYQAAASGDVDVISAFSTDGRIAAFDLKVLEDDRGAIPPYDAVILAGPRLVRDRPEAIAALRQLTGHIDADRMRRMNFAVDQDGAHPATVAEAFLRDLRTTKGNQGIQQ